MGRAVITEFAHLYPERLDRAVSMQVPTMAVIGSRDPMMPRSGSRRSPGRRRTTPSW
jgi:hypothetical protein